MFKGGGGLNNSLDHEPEFFGYKKNVRKSQEFLTQRSEPPPSSRFFEKIPDVIFFTAPKTIGEYVDELYKGIICKY